LRFANPSPLSGWIEDFHLQAADHARHTANGSRECAPDDRLREAIHLAAQRKNGLLRRYAPRNDGAPSAPLSTNCPTGKSLEPVLSSIRSIVARMERSAIRGLGS
jgi:hypothetical protein